MLRVTVMHGRRMRYQGAANEVVLPGEAGEVSVLDFHGPMLCALTAGMIQCDGTRIAIQGGLARVERNTVTILAH